MVVKERKVLEEAGHAEMMTQRAGFHTVGIGPSARSTLARACIDKRLVVGLAETIQCLSVEPERYVFCFLAEPAIGDSGCHLQEVLLQAFCLENDIYIIKVDSAQKLSRLAGSPEDLCHCVLVGRSYGANGTERYSRSDDILIDHCELHWEDPAKPVIKLPEK